MAPGAVSLRYFILGLLAQQAMSGYDIRRFLKSLSWLIGSPSSGSLYPILLALPEEGLATMEVIPGLDKPPKKIYTITAAGQQELQEWIDQPAVSKAPLKAFVMRLLWADNYARVDLAGSHGGHAVHSAATAGGQRKQHRLGDRGGGLLENS